MNYSERKSDTCIRLLNLKMFCEYNTSILGMFRIKFFFCVYYIKLCDICMIQYCQYYFSTSVRFPIHKQLYISVRKSEYFCINR